MSSENLQAMALRLIVEQVLDDLIERNNGLELDDDWADRTILRLIEARDNPEKFLRECPRLPGSQLDEMFPRNLG